MVSDANRHPWAQVSLCLALAVTSLDLTIVNVALPSILRDLGGSNTDGQWIVDAYTLVVAGFVLLGAGLADRYGRRRLFVGGIVLFLVGSLIATLAGSVATLVVGRAVMGLGAAALLPASMSLIAALFPPEARPTVIGRWAMTAGIALAVGPMAGGLLVSAFWWGTVFLIPMPVVAVAGFIAWRTIPESRKAATGPLDLAGAALSVIALGCIVAGLIEGPRLGWSSAPILALLLGGCAALVLLVRVELATSDPIFDVRILRLAPVAGATAAIFLAMLLLFGIMLLVPQFLAFADGLAIRDIGLLMAIPATIYAIVLVRSPVLSRMWGERKVMLAGAVLATGGCLLLAIAAQPGSTVLTMVATTLSFIGFGLLLLPATSVIMNSVDTEHAGSGSAANQVARQVGGAIGVAVIGSLYASLYSGGLAEAAGGTLSGEALASALRSPASAETIAAGLQGSARETLQAAIVASFCSAYAAAMAATAAFVAAAGVVVALTVPRRAPGQGAGAMPEAG